MEESLVGHIPIKEKVAELLKKVLYGHNMRYMVTKIIYDIHDDH